jgi:hypothetical protein
MSDTLFVIALIAICSVPLIVLKPKSLKKETLVAQTSLGRAFTATTVAYYANGDVLGEGESEWFWAGDGKIKTNITINAKRPGVLFHAMVHGPMGVQYIDLSRDGGIYVTTGAQVQLNLHIQNHPQGAPEPKREPVEYFE